MVNTTVHRDYVYLMTSSEEETRSQNVTWIVVDVTFTTRLNFVKLKFNLLEKKIVTECKIKVNIELNSG